MAVRHETIVNNIWQKGANDQKKLKVYIPGKGDGGLLYGTDRDACRKF